MSSCLWTRSKRLPTSPAKAGLGKRDSRIFGEISPLLQKALWCRTISTPQAATLKPQALPGKETIRKTGTGATAGSPLKPLSTHTSATWTIRSMPGMTQEQIPKPPLIVDMRRWTCRICMEWTTQQHLNTATGNTDKPNADGGGLPISLSESSVGSPASSDGRAKAKASDPDSDQEKVSVRARGSSLLKNTKPPSPT